MFLLRQQEERRAMQEALNSLLSDYESDEELTAFTSLDCEDFYATK